MFYLDTAATAKYRYVDDVVVEAMTDAMKRHWQNPSSLYANNVRKEVDECRANIAKFVGAKPNEIYFTSGASESNSWAIRGWVEDKRISTLQHINVITTPIEHKSILEVARKGIVGTRVFHCDVDEFGLVDYKSLEELLIMCEYEPTLVSIGLANNEIGTIQNIETISKMVHKYGGVLHVDATQAVGHMSINVKKFEIDMMSASGHKISPVLKGIGFLYIKNGINIQPLIYGSQESGLRGGTENTFGIIGLSKALERCDVSEEKFNEVCKMRDYFIEMLKFKFDKLGFECKSNGHSEYRLPNNINITIPSNITGEALLYTLDTSNIQIGVGSACNSSSIEPSYVLKTIGLSDDEAMRTIRITIPDDITYEEIDYIVGEIDKSIKLIEQTEVV